MDSEATASAAAAESLDADEVEGLYLAHGARCYALALLLLGDPQLARHALVAVFSAARMSPSQFRAEPGGVATVLLAATHAEACHRARWQRRGNGWEAGSGRFPAVDPPVQRRTDAASDRSHSAPEALTPLELDIVALAYFGARTQEEIATRLDLPLEQVRACTLHAMRYLHQHIGGRIAGPGLLARLDDMTASCAVIAQATGMIMEQAVVDVRAARSMLARRAHTTGVTIADLAATVLRDRDAPLVRWWRGEGHASRNDADPSRLLGEQGASRDVIQPPLHRPPGVEPAAP